MRHWQSWIAGVFLLLLSACQGEDIPATLQAERQIWATETLTIGETRQAQQFAAAATVQAAETGIAELNAVNRVLSSTVRAPETPTPQRVAGVADPSSVGSADMMDDRDDTTDTASNTATTGEQTVTFMQTAASVRQSDGCAAQVQSQFAASTERIYFTTVVNNLQSGTQFVLEWRNEDNGQVEDRSTWTSDTASSSLCVWFYTDGPFLPGAWSATLYVNGSVVEPVVNFTVTGA